MWRLPRPVSKKWHGSEVGIMDFFKQEFPNGGTTKKQHVCNCSHFFKKISYQWCPSHSRALMHSRTLGSSLKRTLENLKVPNTEAPFTRHGSLGVTQSTINSHNTLLFCFQWKLGPYMLPVEHMQLLSTSKEASLHKLVKKKHTP